MALSGCIQGAIYTHTVQPLSTDLNQTPVAGGAAGRGDVKQVRFRMLDVRWDENAIGGIARENGIHTIYYADVEVLRILGLWTQTWTLIYGESDED